MSLKAFEEQNEDDFTITQQREDFMISPSFDGNPTLRTAHFLKPLLNPDIQSLPKTPLLSLTSNPNLTHYSPVRKVYFRGSNNSLGSWISWVDDLQKTHQSIWKKDGIFDAIKCSTYTIKRDNQLIKCLAEKWCTETNTFVFSWGECTLTLEDVMVLGGFSVMGDSVSTQLSHSNKFAVLKDELVNSCTSISKKCNYSLEQSGWMDYFKGKGGDIEHVALIVMWLSRYSFLSKHKVSRFNRSVIDIAINLAMGTKIALAPVVLASIYRDLTFLKERIACHSVEGVASQLVLCSPFHLVQLWAWERFPELSPKPNCLVEGEPRMARWHNVTKLKTTSLWVDIESHAENFIWRPYAVCLNNWNPKYYCDGGMWVVINSEVDEELLSFVRCLRASKLVGLDCVMQYLPHRVGMQFGMDQDIPNFVPRSDSNSQWNCYDRTLEGLKLYLPARLFEGDVTVRYARWWRPVLALDDDALATYPRHKRSLRKRKRLYTLLEDMRSQKQQNVVDGITSSSTALKEQHDTSINDAYAFPEEDKRNMVYEHSKDNHSQVAKGMESDVVRSGNDMPNDEPSSSESIEPKIVDNEATKIESLVMMNSSEIRLEDIFELSVMKVDEKKEVSESSKNMGDCGKYSEGGCSLKDISKKDNGEGRSIDYDKIALLGEKFEDVPHKAEEGGDTKIMKTSMDDIVVISDEESNVDGTPFEDRCIDFKARMEQLDKFISSLKAATCRAMVK